MVRVAAWVIAAAPDLARMARYSPTATARWTGSFNVAAPDLGADGLVDEKEEDIDGESFNVAAPDLARMADAHCLGVFARHASMWPR